MSSQAPSSSRAIPVLSVIIPAYNERENLAELCPEIFEVLDARDFEVIVVDDGSSDGTFDLVRELRARHENLRGLRLRKNGGKAGAYMAGFRAARGEFVATMDGDLQDDPRDLLRLLERVQAGADLVVGWKTSGKSSKVTFVLSRMLNAMLRWFTGMRLHDMNCPIRVMKKDVSRRLDLRADLHRYIPLLAAAAGFKVDELVVANRDRRHGESKYGGSKYLTSAVAFVGMRLYLRFGERPMLLFGTLGLISFLLGFIVDAVVALRHLFVNSNIDDDIPTLVLGAVLILIGTQFLSLGLLAEIVVRRLRLAEHQSLGEVAEELG